MTNIVKGMKIHVTDSYCADCGFKIHDHSYDAEITKVNKKSFLTDKGGKFTFRKTCQDGRLLYANDLGHYTKIK